MYSPNFSAENKIFCLSLHYNGDNSYLFVTGKELTKVLIFQVVTLKIVNCMEMFMTLVLTIVLFQMIKYKIFMLI